MRTILTFVVLCMVVVGPAAAWNRSTHMTTAALAYAELRQNDPAALKEAVRLLRAHPMYQSEWKAEIEGLSEDEQGLRLFLMASRWPDETRRMPAYAHDKWHYINFPFVPEDQPKSLQATGPEADNILVGYETSVATLRSKAPDSTRAVALSWVLHLIGDVHQPLHTIKKVTTDLPAGDRGGNDFYVQTAPGITVVTLHKVWDDLVNSYDDRDAVVRLADRLKSQYPRTSLNELKNERFADWAEKESVPVAIEYVYRNGKLKGSRDHHDQILLPEDYLRTSRPIAERRVTLAGYRIADVLSEAL